jgi:hypothetical protein
MVASELQSYFAASASYSLPEAMKMKAPVLILTEHPAPRSQPDGETIYQVVTAWLAKELRK